MEIYALFFLWLPGDEHERYECAGVFSSLEKVKNACPDQVEWSRCTPNPDYPAISNIWQGGVVDENAQWEIVQYQLDSYSEPGYRFYGGE